MWGHHLNASSGQQHKLSFNTHLYIAVTFWTTSKCRYCFQAKFFSLDVSHSLIKEQHLSSRLFFAGGGSAGRVMERAQCSEQQLQRDVSFLLKSGSTLMHKDQLQFQNSFMKVTKLGLWSQPSSVDRARGLCAAFDHLAFFLCSHKIPSHLSKFIRGQTARQAGQDLLGFVETFASKRIKTLFASQVCGLGFIHSELLNLQLKQGGFCAEATSSKQTEIPPRSNPLIWFPKWMSWGCV